MAPKRKVSFDKEAPVIVEVPRTDIEEDDGDAASSEDATVAPPPEDDFDDDAFDAEFEAEMAAQLARQNPSSAGASSSSPSVASPGAAADDAFDAAFEAEFAAEQHSKPSGGSPPPSGFAGFDSTPPAAANSGFASFDSFDSARGGSGFASFDSAPPTATKPAKSSGRAVASPSGASPLLSPEADSGFASFDSAPPAAADSGFASFDSAPPAAAKLAATAKSSGRPVASPSGASLLLSSPPPADNGFASFDSAPPAAAAKTKRAVAPAIPPAVSQPGGGGGVSTDSDVVQRFEARIMQLEDELRAQPSKQSVSENQERYEALEAQVSKRLEGVKKGMEGLNGRLQAIEIGMAKLPEHFNSFKAQNKEVGREQLEHTEQIEAIQKAMQDLLVT